MASPVGFRPRFVMQMLLLHIQSCAVPDTLLQCWWGAFRQVPQTAQVKYAQFLPLRIFLCMAQACSTLSMHDKDFGTFTQLCPSQREQGILYTQQCDIWYVVNDVCICESVCREYICLQALSSTPYHVKSVGKVTPQADLLNLL